MDLLIILLYILFVLAAIVLIVVVLLQEGKGGGFGQALGTGGSETFGVGARGINTFTAITAGVFLGSAILIHVLNRYQTGASALDNPTNIGGSVLSDPGTSPQNPIQIPPAGGNTTPPVQPPAGENK